MGWHAQPLRRPALTGPVCSYNEWDPLEEVIVGRLDNAVIPQYHVVERVRSVNWIGESTP